MIRARSLTSESSLAQEAAVDEQNSGKGEGKQQAGLAMRGYRESRMDTLNRYAKLQHCRPLFPHLLAPIK